MSPADTSKKTAFSHLGLFYAAAIWGSTFFVVKGVLDDVDPVMLVAYRFLLAGLVMLPALLFAKKRLFAHLKPALVLSIVLWLLYNTQTIGLEYTKASNSGFITGLFVVFLPIFMATIFRQRPTFMEILASITALTGLWVLTGGLREINVGDALTLISALTYALHILYADRYIKAGIDPYVLAFQQFWLIGLLSLIWGLAAGRPTSIGSSEAGWIIVFLAIFPTLSAFVIQMTAQRIVTPLRVSLIFALEPVFAGVFAWTLGGERFLVHGAVGGALIFLALVLSGLPTPATLRRIIPWKETNEPF